MKGAFGVMLVALGIFLAILGGYLLNAETVTTCQTDWQYVTDVSGAFSGDRSDMDVEYSPPSNVTGWSYKQGYNDGYISGVSYTETTRVNSYSAYRGAAVGFDTGTLTVTASQTSGSVYRAGFTATIGSESVEGSMDEGWGVANSEVVGLLSIPGRPTVEGAFGVPLSTVMDLIPHQEIYSSVTFTADSPVSGYPALAVIEKTVSTRSYTHGATTYYNVVVVSMDATASATSAKVMVMESAVRIGDALYPMSDVMLVWGNSQFGGQGTATPSATFSMIYELASERIYVNPAFGVYATSGTIDVASVNVTNHPTSTETTLTVEMRSTQGSVTYEGGIYAERTFSDGQGSGAHLASWRWIGDGTSSVLGLTLQGGSEQSFSADDGSIDIVVTFEGHSATSTVTFSVNGEDAGSIVSSVTQVAAWYVTAGRSNDSPESPYATVRFTAEKQNGDTEVAEGLGAHNLDMSYVTTTQTITPVSYNTAWWANGYSNSSVTLAFQSSSSTAVYTDMTLHGPGGTASLLVGHSSNGWFVELEEQSANVGKWPAIEVELSSSGAVVRPLGAFTSFLDYSVIASPVRIDVQLPFQVIKEIETDGDRAMPMLVVSTTTRITEGGLYLRDATLNLASAFPEELAISLTIGSAAHTGDSITVSRGAASAVLPVDGDRIYIGEAWRPLNGIVFRWMSPEAPAVSAGGVTYSAGIYERGQMLAAGKVWAMVNGQAYEVIDSAEAFQVTLDGVWAPATGLYFGENEAAEKTELADFTKGEYRWDKNDFLIVVMAVCLLGGVAGAYLKRVTLVDWAVIGVAVSVIWLMF